MPPKSSKAKLSCVYHRGTLFKIGDAAFINPDKNAPPFIGKIKQIVQKSSTNEDEIELTVDWYYRPEEAIGGRKAFHGHKELFTSNHEDRVHKNTIIGKCYVHTLCNYEDLPQIADHDYFARFFYQPISKEFEPDRVPVYCTCEMPYNPDLYMIMCDLCEKRHTSTKATLAAAGGQGIRDGGYNRKQFRDEQVEEVGCDGQPKEWYHLKCLDDRVDVGRSYCCQACRTKQKRPRLDETFGT